MTTASTDPFAPRGDTKTLETGLSFAPEFDRDGLIPAIGKLKQRHPGGCAGPCHPAGHLGIRVIKHGDEAFMDHAIQNIQS